MREGHRVIGRTHFYVIIEIDEYIAARLSLLRGRGNEFGVAGLAASAPRSHLIRPKNESRGCVAAGVNLFVAMQARINEVTGCIFHEWPFPSGVRDDQGDVMLPKQFDKFRRLKRFVTHFQGMPNRPDLVGARPRAGLQVVIMLFRERRGFLSIPRKQPEEFLEARFVIAKRRRQLPEGGKSTPICQYGFRNS